MRCDVSHSEAATVDPNRSGDSHKMAAGGCHLPPSLVGTSLRFNSFASAVWDTNGVVQIKVEVSPNHVLFPHW